MKKNTNQFYTIAVKDMKGYLKIIPLNEIKYCSQNFIEVEGQKQKREITTIYLKGDGWRIDADLTFAQFSQLIKETTK